MHAVQYSRPDLAALDDAAAGAHDRRGNAAAMLELGVRRVDDRVDLYLSDVALMDAQRHRRPLLPIILPFTAVCKRVA